MYKRIGAHRVRAAFEALSQGDFVSPLDGVAPDVHHLFPGDNALGGERHSRDAMERWFKRLHVLFPEISFDIREVSVRGWPWDMRIAVQWIDHGKAADGEPYKNEGVHWIRIHRGRAVRIHAYLDTEKVTAALERMGNAGISEAAAPPITD